jgi:hypothetical protein
MQILESSDWGLRSARIKLRSPDGVKTVTLFPMIHIGDAAFYEAAYADAFAHDAVLTEGVRSPVTMRLTRAYRWIVGARHLGLVLQPRAPSTCRARVVHADLTAEEFEQVWSEVSLGLKLLLYVAAPAFALYKRWTATRASLAKGHSMEDLTSRDEILDWNPETALVTRAILEVRDRRLLERLNELLARPDTQTIAIVYGAAHMRAVLAELIGRQGFRPGDMDWMTVISA